MSAKARLNISLDKELADFARIFAAENRISVTEIVTQYLSALKKQTDKQGAVKTSSFHKAMAEVQKRLREGSAVWYDYDEVFGE